jgi:hypothetical protein
LFSVKLHFVRFFFLKFHIARDISSPRDDLGFEVSTQFLPS